MQAEASIKTSASSWLHPVVDLQAVASARHVACRLSPGKFLSEQNPSSHLDRWEKLSDREMLACGDDS